MNKKETNPQSVSVTPKTLPATCKSCKEHFTVGESELSAKLVHKRKFVVEGLTIFLTYYDCPKCGYRHIVQIDNRTTLELLSQTTILMCKLMRRREANRNLPQKQSDKFQKTQRHLSQLRTTLKKEFTDKSCHDDETDTDFIIKFSI